jgi:hypothetical protein
VSYIIQLNSCSTSLFVLVNLCTSEAEKLKALFKFSHEGMWSGTFYKP